MTKLTDTQRILLSSATQRDSGSLLPLPASLKPGGGTAKAIAALLTRRHAEERATDDAAATSRTEGDHRYGVFITVAGVAAIGVELDDGAGGTAADKSSTAAMAAAPSLKPQSKTALVIDLLTRSEGATLSELIAATGWLPHTTRAALTGIRKKGHQVSRGKRDGVARYRIASDR